jgi:hypothetical protein
MKDPTCYFLHLNTYLNMHLKFKIFDMIPLIKGITEVQRKGKKAFHELLDDKKKTDVMYLADRNKIFAVVLTVDEYENLTKKAPSDEQIDWMKATESSLAFWNDPLNNSYDKLKEQL